ncbi:uncharacterized protein [Cicer arietinum]|uniref:uncharacterized protein n=1 Tax=Cicer arietinum TaxID=3827 RepID=UPI00032AC8B1
MVGCGEKLTEQKLCENILRSLHPRFDYIMRAIEESKDISTLSLEELHATLEARELRMDEMSGSKSRDQALGAQTYKKGDQKKKWKKNKFKKPDDKFESASKGGQRKWLVDIDTSRMSKIRFVDDIILEAKGVGNMVIKRRNGKTMVIENVLYVP